MTASWSGSPKTWASGAVTSAEMNTEMRDRMDWLKAALLLYGIDSASVVKPIAGGLRGVKAQRTSGQSLTGSNSIHFNAADEWDSDAFHDIVTNNERITIPSGLGGYYLVCAMAALSASGSPTAVDLWVESNGIDAAGTVVEGLQSRSVYAPAPTILNVSGPVLLAAGDYIAATVLVTGGSSPTLDYASFSAMRLFAT